MLIKKKKLGGSQPSDDSNLNEDLLAVAEQAILEKQKITQAEEQVARSEEAQINQEQVLVDAEALVKDKADELLAAYEAEIEQKRQDYESQMEVLLENARNQAQEIINNAQLEAEKKQVEFENIEQDLEKQKQEIIVLKEQELSRAFDEGMSKADEHINELMHYLSHFQNAKKEVIFEVKSEIVSIALDVAKQLLGHEIETDPNLIEEQLLRSIDKVITTKGVMQVYLHPDDYGKVDYLDKALAKVLDPSVRLVFMEDENVDKGSCIVNTQGGRLDARFSSQLHIIKSIFEKYLGHKIIEIDEIQQEEESLEESGSLDEEDGKETD